MSRTKKSRKPATAPKAQPKLSKAELANVEKRVRKKTGKKPGNRQQEAQPKKNTTKSSQQARDPRLGSKTPIALGKVAPKLAPKKSKPTVAAQQPIAGIRYVETEHNLAQELADIEANEQLHAIVDKQDQDIALTEQEVDYYNKLMDRHQEITEQLDLGDDEEEGVSHPAISSEDDLWDKLDNASDSFTDFE